jgi:hypothetical protein
MTTSLTNHQLVAHSLDQLADALLPVVEPAMRKRYDTPSGPWVAVVRQKACEKDAGRLSDEADLLFLLDCLNKHWDQDFNYGRESQGLVNLLQEARNKYHGHRAAGSGDASADEARHVLANAARLLQILRDKGHQDVTQQLEVVERNLHHLKRRAAHELISSLGRSTAQVRSAAASEPLATEPAITEERPCEQPDIAPNDQPVQSAAFDDRSHATRVSLPIAVPATEPVLYSGNIPANVSKDAKYSCGLDGVIRLLFHLGNREETLLTTDQHPKLVDMVRAVKEAKGESPAGIFYINEYGHVLVKAAGETWYAGTYAEHLAFEFERETIGPWAPKDARSGDVWNGPHVGISYTLTADGRDIYYKRTVRPGVRRKELLSDYADAKIVTDLARPIRQQGGRLYINEAGVLFTPTQGDGQLVYRFLGIIDLAHWFPAPDVTQ